MKHRVKRKPSHWWVPAICVLVVAVAQFSQSSTAQQLFGRTVIVPFTGGGLSTFKSIDIDETEEDVKTSAGQVYCWAIYNNHASATRYVKWYNATAANVTVGTTTPVATWAIPFGSAAIGCTEQGIEFTTAITVAATTGVADNDTGAPSANDVVVNVYYK